jgi:enoyl-CoA hydratase
MTKQPLDENEPSFDIENRGGTLLVKVDGGKHQLFGLKFSKLLDELVDSAENDPDVHAVVFTGKYPDRFVSHADVRWLQEGGLDVPNVEAKEAQRLSSMCRTK